MPEFFHRKIERSAIGFVIAIIAAASVGGIVEIAPLFTIDETVEDAPDMRLYTPLELAGRNIYVREGCYALPQPDDPDAARRGRTLRSLLAGRGIQVRPADAVGVEADRPGPRPHRRQILGLLACRASRSTRATSCRNPTCPHIAGWPGRRSTPRIFRTHLRAQRALGVPYTEEMVANAAARRLRPGHARQRRSRPG